MRPAQSAFTKYDLADLVDIQIGKTPSRNDRDLFGSGHTWLSIADLNGNDVAITSKEEITELGVERSGIKLVPKGALLFSFKLSIGKVAFAGKDLYTNEAIAAFLIKDRSRVDPRYLYYVLREFDFTDGGDKAVKGVTLNKRKLEKLQIPLPDTIDEQRRIAAILDKAQALVANDKRTLAVYDQLAKSLFLEMFGDPVRNERGWEVVTMDSVATKITDGEHATPKRSDSGYLLLSARNIRNRTLDLSNVDHVEQPEFDRIYRRCNPAQGDILISCSGSIGRVTMVRTAEPFVLVRSVALIKPDTKRIDASYLEQYLLTDHMQATMNNSAKSSSQANLFTGPIKALPVMLPPMSMQLKWKKAIEGVDSHRSMAENSLRQSEALFGSLLQGAFSGEMGG